jgi:RNA polymerase sigma-70 factor (ECF subfamily)
MRQVLEGDVSLISVLFDRHHRKLFRYCWRMTGETQLSEDLVQEVFLKILRHRETFGAGSSFTTWMYAIARNAHNDAWRKRRRETALEAGNHLAASNGEVLEQRQETAMLQRALMQLPDDKREVLVMSRFLGMSHAEIARVLGCDEGASRARLHRALNTLRQIYQAGVGGRIS